MFNKTVTVFNHNGDKWLPRVISGVFVSQDMGYILRTYGTTQDANAAIHFPVKAGKIGEYTYDKPKEWESLVEKTGHITFRGGEEFDIIMLGEWLGTGAIDDGDYSKGFYHYLKTTQDSVWAATKCAEYQTIPHIEVVAK